MMQPHQQPKFAELVWEMSVAFRAQLSEGEPDVWWKYLSPFITLRQATYATRDCISRGGKFPSIGEFKQMAMAYREFKTVEKPSVQIEEFSSASEKPESAEDFFRKVGMMFGECLK